MLMLADHRMCNHLPGLQRGGVCAPWQNRFPKLHSRSAQVETARGTWRSRALVSRVRSLATSDQRLRRRLGSTIACEAKPRAVQAALGPPRPTRRSRTEIRIWRSTRVPSLQDDPQSSIQVAKCELAKRDQVSIEIPFWCRSGLCLLKRRRLAQAARKNQPAFASAELTGRTSHHRRSHSSTNTTAMSYCRKIVQEQGRPYLRWSISKVAREPADSSPGTLSPTAPTLAIMPFLTSSSV
jgi:hypothetical protein